MSVPYGFLMETYPESFPESPIIVLIRVFLAVALFLIVPYIYARFIEERFIAFLIKIGRHRAEES